MKEKGLVLQLARGLYQLPYAPLDANHSLAEASKLVPKGTVCLVSALAFHGLTDALPARVWMAIGPKDRRPSITHPPIQFVRFGDRVLGAGVEAHDIEGVTVRIYNPAKTVADMRRRKATPSEIARYTRDAGVCKVIQPYLQAMIANA